MPCSREQLEQRERQTLASYAQFSADSRGRVHPEPPPLWRTEYQSDGPPPHPLKGEKNLTLLRGSSMLPKGKNEK
jgi:hypothetical protein